MRLSDGRHFRVMIFNRSRASLCHFCGVCILNASESTFLSFLVSILLGLYSNHIGNYIHIVGVTHKMTCICWLAMFSSDICRASFEKSDWDINNDEYTIVHLVASNLR